LEGWNLVDEYVHMARHGPKDYLLDSCTRVLASYEVSMRKIISVSRRRFVQWIAGLSASSSFPGIVAAQATGDGRQDASEAVLVRMLKLLFPHQEIDQAIYDDMATHVFGVATRDKDDLSALTTGLANLDGSEPGSWLAGDTAVQSMELEKVANSRFFALVRVTALEYLYRDPRAWQLVGYEGSAIQHGGYVNRGFNDIDWLPGS
jgi:hypothetical protein